MAAGARSVEIALMLDIVNLPCGDSGGWNRERTNLSYGSLCQIANSLGSLSFTATNQARQGQSAIWRDFHLKGEELVTGWRLQETCKAEDELGAPSVKENAHTVVVRQPVINESWPDRPHAPQRHVYGSERRRRKAVPEPSEIGSQKSLHSHSLDFIVLFAPGQGPAQTLPGDESHLQSGESGKSFGADLDTAGRTH